jgi:predicted NBD/HSP70 family sugar kinase
VGCWETEIGERALLLHAGRDPEGGRVAIDALIDDATAGEPRALSAVAHVARWLGVGLGSLVNIFDPERIVLGGIFERIHPLIAVALDRELDARALLASRELVRVVPGALGIDGPLIGAAEHAFEPMLADPAVRLEAIHRRPLRASA